MGVYLCIASNGVPPSISKRVQLKVQCKSFVYVFLLLFFHFYCLLPAYIRVYGKCTAHNTKLDLYRLHIVGFTNMTSFNLYGYMASACTTNYIYTYNEIFSFPFLLSDNVPFSTFLYLYFWVVRGCSCNFVLCSDNPRQFGTKA